MRVRERTRCGMRFLCGIRHAVPYNAMVTLPVTMALYGSRGEREVSTRRLVFPLSLILPGLPGWKLATAPTPLSTRTCCSASSAPAPRWRCGPGTGPRTRST